MTNVAQKAEKPRRLRAVRDPERFALLGVWAVIIVFFVIAVPNTFPTAANLSSMLGSQAVLLILTLGLIIPLRAGDYDLSVASVFSLSAVTATSPNRYLGWPKWAAWLAAQVAGCLFGGLNGLLRHKFGH